MSKKLVYILACLLTFLVILLTVFMIFVIANNGFSFKNNRGFIFTNYNKIIKEKTYDLNNVEHLDFGLIASDIKFLVSDNNELKVVQYGNKKSKKFNEKVDNNSIEITDNTQFNIGFFNINSGSRYEIYLPNSYTNNLNIKTVSGEIELNSFELNIKNLIVKSTSGDISLDSNIKANKIETSTISGDISVNSFISENIKIKTTSGDINVDNIDSKVLAVSTISGQISLGNITGELSLKTTSGDITVSKLLILDNSEISSLSGEIRVKMDNKNNCNIDTDSMSGDEDVNTNKYGNSKYELKIKTTSGDIEVD